MDGHVFSGRSSEFVRDLQSIVAFLAVENIVESFEDVVLARLELYWAVD